MNALSGTFTPHAELSPAAARAWGLLRGEERWIAAALMPL